METLELYRHTCRGVRRKERFRSRSRIRRTGFSNDAGVRAKPRETPETDRIVQRAQTVSRGTVQILLNEGYAVLVGNTVAFHALKPLSSMMPYVIQVLQAEISIQGHTG